MIGNRTNHQRESRLFVQEEGMANYAQRHSDMAEVGVVGIVKKRDFLTVLFVLLRPPANADQGKVG